MGREGLGYRSWDAKARVCCLWGGPCRREGAVTRREVPRGGGGSGTPPGPAPALRWVLSAAPLEWGPDPRASPAAEDPGLSRMDGPFSGAGVKEGRCADGQGSKR